MGDFTCRIICSQISSLVYSSSSAARLVEERIYAAALLIIIVRILNTGCFYFTGPPLKSLSMENLS